MTESKMGTFKPITDFANWREDIVCKNKIKLDDKAKTIYLNKLRETGKRGLAATAAGVSPGSVKKHMDIDPDFLEAAEIAYNEYREVRLERIENQAIKGFKEPFFGPNGEVGYRRKYETQLRLAMLQKLDPEYRPNNSVVNNNTIQLGAVVMPATLGEEEWEARFLDATAKPEGRESGTSPVLTEGSEVKNK